MTRWGGVSGGASSEVFAHISRASPEALIQSITLKSVTCLAGRSVNPAARGGGSSGEITGSSEPAWELWEEPTSEQTGAAFLLQDT